MTYHYGSMMNLLNEYEGLEQFPKHNCSGESMFTEEAGSTTAAYYEPVYKDGINMNPDSNTSTSTVTCITCGQRWKKTSKLGNCEFKKL